MNTRKKCFEISENQNLLKRLIIRNKKFESAVYHAIFALLCGKVVFCEYFSLALIFVQNHTALHFTIFLQKKTYKYFCKFFINDDISKAVTPHNFSSINLVFVFVIAKRFDCLVLVI